MKRYYQNRYIISSLMLPMILVISGCGEDKKLICNIYSTLGGNRTLISSTEVANQAECDALLERARSGR